MGGSDWTREASDDGDGVAAGDGVGTFRASGVEAGRREADGAPASGTDLTRFFRFLRLVVGDVEEDLPGEVSVLAGDELAPVVVAVAVVPVADTGPPGGASRLLGPEVMLEPAVAEDAALLPAEPEPGTAGELPAVDEEPGEGTGPSVGTEPDPGAPAPD